MAKEYYIIQHIAKDDSVKGPERSLSWIIQVGPKRNDKCLCKTEAEGDLTKTPLRQKLPQVKELQGQQTSEARRGQEWILPKTLRRDYGAEDI